MAEKLGAKILGLGAFTSVVGDAGITIAKGLDVPVTTGDAYTISIAVEALRKSAKLMDINLAKSTAAVVGAGGTIGKVCAELLADDVQKLYLLGRHIEPLEKLKTKLDVSSQADIRSSTDLSHLADADLILTVTSAVNEDVIRPEHLRTGSVVCDVARPRDVSAMVAEARDDILVIDGGMVDIPGMVNFNFDFGFPEGKAYACMAETMALALEGRFEDYTLGKEITRAHVDEITEIARKHGFRLSGFRSFEKEITAEKIQAVRSCSAKKKSNKKRGI
jgi:predicted amino acid dehydrogenase